MLPRTLATIAMLAITTPVWSQQIRTRVGNVGTLSITGGQSSTRSITSQSASVTTMDGYPGQIVNQQLRPFVTGITPVVGDRAVAGPVVNARDATLNRISQSAAARDNAKLTRYLRRAESAAEKGNARMARANYKMALGLADPVTAAAIHRRLSIRESSVPIPQASNKQAPINQDSKNQLGSTIPNSTIPNPVIFGSI